MWFRVIRYITFIKDVFLTSFTVRICSPLKSVTACLSSAFPVVSCFAYSSTLKMEARCSSKTSVYFQWTTRHDIPEYRILQWEYCLLDLPSFVCKLGKITRNLLHDGNIQAEVRTQDLPTERLMRHSVRMTQPWSSFAESAWAEKSLTG
jgi:hypothetical protein